MGVESSAEKWFFDWLAQRDPALLVLLKDPHLLICNGFSHELGEENSRRDTVQQIQRSRLPHPSLMHWQSEQPN